jgi:hypothetical protein
MLFLRGHHLICLNFFSGKGYDEVFVDNLKGIMKGIDAEVIRITDGPDDVCKSCPHLKGNRCLYDKEAEEEVREMDSKALQLLNIKAREISWREIKDQIPLIFSEWYKSYCLQCDWLRVCNENELFIKGLINE